MRLETDFSNYIQNRLLAAEIFADSESSRNVELNGALQTASKNQTGYHGYPDHIALVRDFVLVMEDKSDRLKLVLREDGEISQTVDATKNYAVNGALFYARKIIDGTRYKKIFAFGNAGDRKHHTIKPIFIDADKNVTELPEVDTFQNFTAQNIESYYRRMVLNETPPEEVELRKILRHAGELHEYLRNYGALGEMEKPLVVSAILLALAERKFGFSVEQLTGDTIKTDGAKIFEQVENHLRRASVRPEVKKSQVLDQFRLIKNRPLLNTVNRTLEKTPLRYFTEFIEDKIYDAVVNNSAEDYLGRFYGEFISYSGGDGQSLGVVLTPRHITELFCDLVDLKPDDVVFDPCCGTGSFLIAAMSRMLKDADDAQRNEIKQNQLHGIDNRDDMFSIATTNMILRGDGKSNLICGDFFAKTDGDLQKLGATVGMMNPPYSQAKNAATAHLSELNFVRHLLDSVTRGGRVAVIVPVSAMIGKTGNDKLTKGDILKSHTLEGVISLNKQTFYGVGTVPCIAVFTAGVPHTANKRVKFINFEDDGFEVKKHVGLVETERAKDRKSYLLDCWHGKITDAPSKFMVSTTIAAQDEWLHSFYYYNDELPTENDFESTVADYLTFEFSMIAHGREYLFERKKKLLPLTETPPLSEKLWRPFIIGDVFNISSGKRLTKADMTAGNIPFIGASDSNNGVTAFIRNENISADSNVLGVNYDGNGMVISFYHPYRCVFSDSVKRFKLKNFIGNESIYLFMKASILQQKNKYNYGYKFSGSRMQRQKILLPVNDDDAPDYEYMAAYIRSIEEKILQSYREFVTILPPPATIQPLDEKLWREFRLLDYFDFSKGDQNNMAALTAGNLPLISAKDNSNGLKDFVSENGKKIFDEDCLTLNNDGDGGAGIAYYQPMKFLLDTHVTALIPRRKLSREALLFVAQCITIQREKFGHGYSLNNRRLNVFRVMLPATDDGEPDFDYMAAYVRNLTAAQYRRYLNYIDGEKFSADTDEL